MKITFTFCFAEEGKKQATLWDIPEKFLPKSIKREREYQESENGSSNRYVAIKNLQVLPNGQDSNTSTMRIMYFFWYFS